MTTSHGVLPDHRAWRFSREEEQLTVFRPFSSRAPIRLPVSDASTTFPTAEETNKQTEWCVTMSTFGEDAVMLCSHVGNMVWFSFQQQQHKLVEGRATLPGMQTGEVIVAVTSAVDHASSAAESWHVLATSKGRILVTVLTRDELIDISQLHSLIVKNKTPTTPGGFLSKLLLGSHTTDEAMDVVVDMVTRNGLVGVLTQLGTVLVFAYDPNADESFTVLMKQRVAGATTTSFGAITLAFHMGCRTPLEGLVVVVAANDSTIYRWDATTAESEFKVLAPSDALHDTGSVVSVCYLDSKAITAITVKTSPTEYQVFNSHTSSQGIMTWEIVFSFYTEFGWGLLSDSGEAAFWNSDSLMDVVPFNMFRAQHKQPPGVPPTLSSAKKKRNPMTDDVLQPPPPISSSSSKKKPLTPIDKKRVKNDEGWRVILNEALDMVIRAAATDGSSTALRHVESLLKTYDTAVLQRGCLAMAEEIVNRDPRPRWATTRPPSVVAAAAKDTLSMDTINAVNTQLLDKLVQLELLVDVAIGLPATNNSDTQAVAFLLELWEKIGFAIALFSFADTAPHILVEAVRQYLPTRLNYGTTLEEFEKELEDKGWDITDEVFSRVGQLEQMLDALHELADKDASLSLDVNEMFCHSLDQTRVFFARKAAAAANTNPITYRPAMLESDRVKELIHLRLESGKKTLMMIDPETMLHQMYDLAALEIWSSLQVRDLIGDDAQAEQYIIDRNTSFVHPLVQIATAMKDEPLMSLSNSLARQVAEMASDFESLLRCCTHLQNMGVKGADDVLTEYTMRFRHSLLRSENNFLVSNEDTTWRLAFEGVSVEGGGRLVASKDGDVFAIERFPNLSDELVVVKRFDSLMPGANKAWITFDASSGQWTLTPITSREQESEPPAQAFFFRVVSEGQDHVPDKDRCFHLLPARRGTNQSMCFHFRNGGSEAATVDTVILNPSDWVDFPQEALKNVFITHSPPSRAFQLAHRCGLEQELVNVLEEIIHNGDVGKRSLVWMAKLGAKQFAGASADLRVLSAETDKIDTIDDARITHAIGLLSARLAVLQQQQPQQPSAEKLEEFHKKHGEPWKRVVEMNISPLCKKHAVVEALTEPSRFTTNTNGIGVETVEAFDLAMSLVLDRQAFRSLSSVEIRSMMNKIMARAFVVEFKLWTRWLSLQSRMAHEQDIRDEVEANTMSKRLADNYCKSNAFDVDEFFKPGGEFDVCLRACIGRDDTSAIMHGLMALVRKMVFGK